MEDAELLLWSVSCKLNLIKKMQETIPSDWLDVKDQVNHVCEEQNLNWIERNTS